MFSKHYLLPADDADKYVVAYVGFGMAMARKGLFGSDTGAVCLPILPLAKG
jgi:hypothetical protein